MAVKTRLICFSNSLPTISGEYLAIMSRRACLPLALASCAHRYEQVVSAKPKSDENAGNDRTSG